MKRVSELLLAEVLDQLESALVGKRVVPHQQVLGGLRRAHTHATQRSTKAGVILTQVFAVQLPNSVVYVQ